MPSVSQRNRRSKPCTAKMDPLLTTDSSIHCKLLRLISRVVSDFQVGMMAVTGQSEATPSASHWANSEASGTRISCRHDRGAFVPAQPKLNGGPTQCLKWTGPCQYAVPAAPCFSLNFKHWAHWHHTSDTLPKISYQSHPMAPQQR